VYRQLFQPLGPAETVNSSEDQVTPQCGSKANAVPHKKHDTLRSPYKFNCLWWKIALLEDCSVGCLSLDTERVTTMVLHAVLVEIFLCPVKTV